MIRRVICLASEIHWLHHFYSSRDAVCPYSDLNKFSCLAFFMWYGFISPPVVKTHHKFLGIKVNPLTQLTLSFMIMGWNVMERVLSRDVIPNHGCELCMSVNDTLYNTVVIELQLASECFIVNTFVWLRYVSFVVIFALTFLSVLSVLLLIKELILIYFRYSTKRNSWLSFIVYCQEILLKMAQNLYLL